MEQKTEERAHHPFSPSTLQAREACPKFCQRQDSVNDKALRGTMQHAAAEAGQDDLRLSDDEALAVAECLDFVDSRRRVMQAERQWAVESMAQLCGYEHAEKTVPQVLDLQEIYLPIDNLTISYIDPFTKERKLGQSTTAGYIDIALVNHDRTYAEITDYKFGMWEVESADNNLQGIAYTLGMFLKYPTLKKVRVYFKQPHIGVLNHTDFEVHKCLKHLLRVRTVVARAIGAFERPDDFSMATPTEGTCIFCALIGRCDKVAEIYLNVGKKFAPLQVPADITPSVLRDPKQAALALKCGAIAKIWGDAVRTVTSNAVIAGSMDMPEGYRIESRSDRFIANADEFKKVAMAYLTDEEYKSLIPEATPALTKVEKLINEKAPRGVKTETVKEFNAKLVEHKAIDREPPITFLKQATKPKTT
jgi:hypothetical protein